MISPWIHKGEVWPGVTNIDEAYGFVYKITNKLTGKFYIGAKFCWKPKYNIVKGKKKKTMIQSDYMNYWSSSEALNEDVKLLGKNMFTREVVEVVRFRGMVKYLESKMIFALECLERDDCYNSIVGCKIHRRCVRR